MTSIPPKTIETEQERIDACPHCGKSGMLVFHVAGEGYSIVCGGRTSCLASVGMYGGQKFNKAEAIAAWNRRTPPPVAQKPRTYVTHDDFDFSDMPMDGAYNPFGGPL